MKRFPLHALLTGLCVLAIVAATSFAQDPAERDEPARDSQKTGARVEAGKLDPNTSRSTIRASQLIGMSIENNEKQSVGKINDLVLDAENGAIRYAAVTSGGFLGIGDKLFAVPWQAFKFRHDPERDEHLLVLDVTRKMLEGEEGFDQDHWPDFADPNFVADLHKRYGVEQRTGSRAEEDVDTKPKQDR
jgi:sporulation protein YlmC with PRC-barrel domain